MKEKYLIEGVYDFSIKDDKVALKKFRSDVAKFLKDNPSWEKQEIPVSYYKIKEKLEKLFVKGNEVNELIKKEDFDKIANRYKINNIEQLLDDLHALGVSLWYKDLDKYNTLVLNPEWISDGCIK